MKRIQFGLLLTSSLAVMSAITVSVINSNANYDFYKLFSSNGGGIWSHYEEVSPTFDSTGIKEYWVSCSTSEHQFEAPADAQIVDKGQPSEEFIKTITEDDDRFLPQIPEHISFEDDYDARFILSSRYNTAEISTEQYHFGGKSLKIVTSGDIKALTISKAYYDALPDTGLSFWVYSGTAFNGFLGSGNTIYNGGKTNTTSISYWDTNAWRQFVISKSSITLEDGNYFVFKTGMNVTLYIDDVKPYDPTPKTVYDFEDQYDTMTVNSQAPAASYEISTEQAFSGNGSLKVSGLNNYEQAFNLSDDFYNSLPDAGVSFWVYASQAFNMRDGAFVDSNHYWGPFNVWKHYVFSKDQIDATAGRHFVFLPWGIDPAPLTIYIDDVKPYDPTPKAIYGFEDLDDMATINSQGASYEISAEQAHNGNGSLKVSGLNNYEQAFNLSDDFYNSLPDAGVSFWVYASQAFNMQDGASEAERGHYWGPFNVWKHYVFSKAQIDATAGRHYVFLPWGIDPTPLTIYIDDVRAADFVETDNISGDTRNTNEITDELIYEGTRSLKVVMNVANSGLFLIKDSFFNSLPDAGVSFYVNCSRAFNAGVAGGPGLEYRNLNEWQQFTVAKANIQYSTSIDGVTYYYVCLPSESFEAPIYVDGITAASANQETLNSNIINNVVDDSWY